jgi:WD40 repeat protein
VTTNNAVLYPSISFAPIRARALASLAVIALLCLLPSISVAQGALPIQWMYSQISQVTGVAYSPNGALFAVAGQGGIQIYSSTTGTLVASLPTAATNGVTSIAFSPDGKKLVDGGGNALGGVLELWSVMTGNLDQALNTSANQGIASVAFSSDGVTVADGGSTFTNNIYSGVLELWNASTGVQITTLSTAATAVLSVAISPDGSTVLDGGDNGQGGVLELWNVSTGGLTLSLNTSANEDVAAVAFSPDGKTLADGGQGQQGGVLELWNFATGAQISTLATSANYIVNSVAFSSDGKTLADCGQNYTTGGELELWNFSAGTLISTLATTANNVLNSVAFSPSGAVLLDGGLSFDFTTTVSEGVFETWTVPGGTPGLSVSTGPGRLVSSVAISPDGTTLADGGAVLSATLGILELWNNTTGKLATSLNTAANLGVSSVVFSPNGTDLADCGQSFNPATGVSAGVVEVWDALTGKLLQSFATSAISINSVAFSPDGTMIADCGQVFNSTTGAITPIIEIWSVTSGSLVSTIGTFASTVNSVVFSPDGTMIADGGQSTDPNTGITTGVLELWNVAAGTLVATLPTSATFVETAVFSPDGKTVADGGMSFDSNGNQTGIVEFWGVAKGNPLATPALAAGSGSVLSLAYSPDGAVLFVGTGGNLQTVSSVTYGLVGTYSVGNVTSLAVSSSGALFAYSSNNGAIVVAASPEINSDPVSSLIVTPSSVAGGSSATGTVTLSQPAPSLGAVVELSSGNPAVFVPASIIVAPGANSATFSVATTNVPSNVAATITATSGGVSTSATLSVTYVQPPLHSLTLSPTTIVGGNVATGTVTLGGPAGAGGVTVSISSSSSSASVVGTALVATGQTSGTFTITTAGVSTQTTSKIVASLSGQSQSATLTITPASLALVTVSPTAVLGGAGSTGTVSLSGNAGSGGYIVTLASSNSAATVPKSVTVPAGQSEATFAIKTSAVSTQKVVTISGKNGSVSKSATLTVNPPAITSITLSASAVVGSTSCTGTVTISAPAGIGGVSVSLTSSSTFATVPASVIVASGKTSAGFTVKTLAVPVQKEATISASSGGATQSATLAITAPVLVLVSVSPTSVVGGNFRNRNSDAERARRHGRVASEFGKQHSLCDCSNFRRGRCGQDDGHVHREDACRRCSGGGHADSNIWRRL